MVTTLKVESFKSLANVSIDLGQINVLIGANGSGKSNLLEALGILGAAASGRVDDARLLERGVRPGVPALYKTSLRGRRASTFVQFSATWLSSDGDAQYGVGLHNPIVAPEPAWRFGTEVLKGCGGVAIFGRSPRSKQRGNPEAGLAALKLVEMDPEAPEALLLESLRDYRIYSPSTLVLRGLVPDTQQHDPVGLSGGRLPDAVLDVIRAAGMGHNRHAGTVANEVFGLIDWANQYATAPRSTVMLSPSVPRGERVLLFRDKFMSEKRNTLTGYDASEGALYVLFSAVLASHPSVPRLLAVDNFDHGLNPRLARELVRRFCKWVLGAPLPRQVLLTTHNPLVLDGLDLADDRIRLFAVDRTSRGATVVSRVVPDDAMRERAERDGLTLSRMWLQGLIGGVPDV